MSKKRIAIFASGSGTNAEAIAKYFTNHDLLEVSLILTNNPSAFVLERARRLGISSFVFNRNEFYQSESVLERLKADNIDCIVLAGFLWLVPKYLITTFEHMIINIHPALLPNYGGKGMYGNKVHEAVVNNKEKESGITIHLVDEIYDNGKILCQAKVTLKSGETPDTLAFKIHELEHQYFPQAIEEYLLH